MYILKEIIIFVRKKEDIFVQNVYFLGWKKVNG